MLCKLISIGPIFGRLNQSKDLMRCFHWPIRIKSKSTKIERKRLTKSHEIEFNYDKLNIRQKTSIRKKLPHRKKITFTFTLLSITLMYLSSFTIKFTVCAHNLSEFISHNNMSTTSAHSASFLYSWQYIRLRQNYF